MLTRNGMSFPQDQAQTEGASSCDCHGLTPSDHRKRRYHKDEDTCGDILSNIMTQSSPGCIPSYAREYNKAIKLIIQIRTSWKEDSAAKLSR